MRNTGVLLLLVGIYIIVNSGSFRDLVFGKAEIGFLTPSAKGRAVGGSYADDEAKKDSDALPSSIAERFGGGNAS